MAANAGVPDSEMIGKSAAEIEQLVEARMAGNSNTIDQGKSGIQNEGTDLQTEAQSATQPGNQSHMVNATGQVANAGVDMVTDGIAGLKQAGSQMIDGLIGDTPPPQARTNQGSQEPWTGHDQDLPPIDDQQPAGEKAWANKLQD